MLLGKGPEAGIPPFQHPGDDRPSGLGVEALGAGRTSGQTGSQNEKTGSGTPNSNDLHALILEGIGGFR